MKKTTWLLLFLALILRGEVWAQKTTAKITIPDEIPNNPIVKTGWQLLWHDEFDIDSINPYIWWPQVTETPGTLTYFTPRPENVRIENGLLHVVNQKENYKRYPFTGGNIYSAKKIEINSRVEAAMQIPTGKSLWPCFWLLGAGGSDSLYQEVDIAEFRCSDPMQFNISNHFWNKKKRKVRQEFRSIYPRNKNKNKVDLSKKLHLYVVEWTTQSLRFYLDNILVYELKRNIPYLPMHLILSMGVGGLDGDPNKQTQFPADFSFDYVRVYKKTNSP